MPLRGWWIPVVLLACAPRPAGGPTPATTLPVASAAPEPEGLEPAAGATPPAEPALPGPAPLSDDYLRFAAGCTPGERAVLAAAGDLLVHHELQKQAFAAKEGFRTLWAGVAESLTAADLTYLNLEVPLAAGIDANLAEVPDPGRVFDNVVYTGYPRFNVHPSLARDLDKSGVDLVSTANNHALDRGPVGIDRTIEALRSAGVRHVGTRRRAESDASWSTTLRAGSLKLAFVACTRHTNQIADPHHQVLRCDKDAREIDRLIARLAARKGIDAVIVLPHQGKEYEAEPSQVEIDRAHRWLEAGALAVLASHPHVVQRWEKHVTADGRETFVIYSLGNFASHQQELERRAALILYLGLTRGDDGKTRINGVRYAPIHVRKDGPRFFTEQIDPVAGPLDARAHLTGVLGASNVLEAGGPVVTDPHCEEGWRPAPSPSPPPG